MFPLRMRKNRGLPKSIDTVDGPGSTSYLMCHRVKLLLNRLRLSTDFPVPVKEFLESVYPQEFIDSLSTTNDRWGNLVRCLHAGTVAHFAVDDRNEHETFWVKSPDNRVFPTPDDGSVLLSFGEWNPHFAAVNKWLDTALEINTELHAIYEITSMFLRQAKYGYKVKELWPELFKFMDQDLLPKQHWMNEKPVRVDLPIPRVRSEVTDALARATLMPDRVVLAWVQYPEGE